MKIKFIDEMQSEWLDTHPFSELTIGTWFVYKKELYAKSDKSFAIKLSLGGGKYGFLGGAQVIQIDRDSSSVVLHPRYASLFI